MVSKSNQLCQWNCKFAHISLIRQMLIWFARYL